MRGRGPAGPGVMAAIMVLPRPLPPGRAVIPGPTHDEHAAASRAAGPRRGSAPTAASPRGRAGRAGARVRRSAPRMAAPHALRTPVAARRGARA